MAGKRKKLSRRELKNQKQRQKNRVCRRTGWQEPVAPAINQGLLQDLRPFLNEIYDDLPELEPQTAPWATLAAALIGEVNTYEADE